MTNRASRFKVYALLWGSEARYWVQTKEEAVEIAKELAKEYGAMDVWTTSGGQVIEHITVS